MLMSGTHDIIAYRPFRLVLVTSLHCREDVQVLLKCTLLFLGIGG